MRHNTPRALGGPLFSPGMLFLAGLGAIGLLVIGWRMFAGLGAVSALNDGYPWGLWIAYDVVTGTAFGSGGYAMALLVYILNRGKYHPLVRPAMLTSALGYTLAALSVMIDIGRPWNAWRLIRLDSWNHRSVLLEVAVCVLAYTAVLWVELGPAFLEGFTGSKSPKLRRVSEIFGRPLERALPFVLALGMTLPTMHQSSLGGLLMIARFKVHPLWYSPALPLLFLVSCVAMGYAAVVVESAVGALIFHREPERDMLVKIGGFVPWLSVAFIFVRLGDLGLRGKLGQFGETRFAVLFFAELALMIAPAFMLVTAGQRARLGNQLRAAILLLLGGALYRFDAFLVAFNPGHFSYFPAVPEIFVSVGLIALEFYGYAVIVKRFPILSAAPLERTA